MAPAVDGFVNCEWTETFCALGNDNASPALIKLTVQPVAVKSLVGEQVVECDAVNKRRHTNRIEPVTGQEYEAHEIAKRISQREDFGRPAAFRLADGLIFSPPFAPCPWRCTLTIVASTMAYSMSGSSETASKIVTKTPAFTQSL